MWSHWNIVNFHQSLENKSNAHNSRQCHRCCCYCCCSFFIFLIVTATGFLFSPFSVHSFLAFYRCECTNMVDIDIKTNNNNKIFPDCANRWITKSKITEEEYRRRRRRQLEGEIWGYDVSHQTSHVLMSAEWPHTSTIYIHCTYVLFFFFFLLNLNNSIECNPDHTHTHTRKQHRTIDETIVHDHTKSGFTIQKTRAVFLYHVRNVCSPAIGIWLFFFFGCLCGRLLCMWWREWIVNKKKKKKTNRQSNESPMTKPQREMDTIWRTIQIIRSFIELKEQNLCNQHMQWSNRGQCTHR